MSGEREDLQTAIQILKAEADCRHAGQRPRIVALTTAEIDALIAAGRRALADTTGDGVGGGQDG